MSLTPIYISGYSENSGYETDKKPFMLPDQAFPTLENAYVWRNRVKKREGNELLGRLRRIFLVEPIVGGLTFVNPSPNTFNLFTLLAITEPNAEIEVPSASNPITIVIGAQTLTDTLGNGTFLVTGAGNITAARINYSTGDIIISFSAPFGPAATTVSFNYFPSLPSMGIWTRDLSTVNSEQTIFFDTKYAYIYTGGGFQEWISGTTWNASDSDFFLAANYRGIEPSDRLFFVTNFVNDASNPMRYSNGTIWTDFVPLIGATTEQESLGDVVTPWLAFAGVLTQLPIVEGTVVITVGDIIFTDEQEDGTLTGSPSTNTGTINYATGAITLAFSPALEEDTPVSVTYNWGKFYMFQAKILIPYYGRLLALNTYEGETIGNSSNIYNRCRFSQIGSPVQNDAWRSDIFGKGGFIDAPTAESIVSATFYKNTLIVFFERSTWQLRYVGEYGLPFIWERISSDFGSESTFSTILFDEGVLTVGDKAIVSSTGINVSRIDERIPDLVYTFRNANNGIARVHGARNFQKELVFWCYSDSNDQEVGQYFPNKVLLANYRNKTFSILRDNITCFGTFQPTTGVTWDDLFAFWDSPNIFWDDADSQSQFPFIVCGNSQGYISYYLKEDVVQNDESLSISGVDLTGISIQLTVINHNLLTGDIIYIEGLKFQDASNDPVATDLNDNIYQVVFVDVDTISLNKWNGTQYVGTFAFSPPDTSIYIGGGSIALLPKMTIQTKDFNPYAQQGSQLKISYVDLLTDAQFVNDEEVPDTMPAVSVNLYMNSAINQSANVIVGNTRVETSLPAPYYPPGIISDYAWHRFFATATGQYMRVEITYDDVLMNDITTHQSTFVMNAMCLWVRTGSKTTF